MIELTNKEFCIHVFLDANQTILFRRLIAGSIDKLYKTTLISRTWTYFTIEDSKKSDFDTLYNIVIALVFAIKSNRKWEDLLMQKNVLVNLIDPLDYVQISNEDIKPQAIDREIFIKTIDEIAKAMAIFQILDLMESSIDRECEEILDKWKLLNNWIKASKRYFFIWIPIIRNRIWKLIPRKLVSGQKQFLYLRYVNFVKIKRQFLKNDNRIQVFIEEALSVNIDILGLMNDNRPKSYYSSEIYLANWGIIYAKAKMLEGQIEEIKLLVDSTINPIFN